MKKHYKLNLKKIVTGLSREEGLSENQTNSSLKSYMAETSHLSGPGEDLPAKGSSGGPGGQP